MPRKPKKASHSCAPAVLATLGVVAGLFVVGYAVNYLIFGIRDPELYACYQSRTADHVIAQVKSITRTHGDYPVIGYDILSDDNGRVVTGKAFVDVFHEDYVRLDTCAKADLIRERFLSRQYQKLGEELQARDRCRKRS